MTAIKGHGFGNAIFRGEHLEDRNTELMSTISRSDVLDYRQMLKDYHFEMEPKLDTLSSKYFLAFARHHGMSTNLLDFTFSPLVALYFACENIKVDEVARVHAVYRNKLISIDDFVLNKDFGWTCCDDIIEFDNEIIKFLITHINSYIKNKESFTQIKSLILDCLTCLTNEKTSI